MQKEFKHNWILVFFWWFYSSFQWKILAVLIDKTSISIIVDEDDILFVSVNSMANINSEIY